MTIKAHPPLSKEEIEELRNLVAIKKEAIISIMKDKIC
jgi:hypothetical protein